MSSFPFNLEYDPPAPACQIYLNSTRGRRVVGPLPAILDTGADGTLIPLRYLKEIGATRTFETGLRSQWGERRVVYLYMVNLRIDRIDLSGVFVVGDDQSEEIVIGRNILNQFKIIFDGPNETTQVTLSPSNTSNN
jgi:predicted aspartyl protease